MAERFPTSYWRRLAKTPVHVNVLYHVYTDFVWLYEENSHLDSHITLL